MNTEVAVVSAVAEAQETMSSLDFLNNIINPARLAAGESEVRNNDFVAKIEDELTDLGVIRNFRTTTSQGAIREVKGYDLTVRQMTIMGMRESKAVRNQVADILEEKYSKPAIPQTYSQALMAAAQLAERNEQLALEKKVAVEEKEQAQEEVRCMDKLLAGGAVYNSTQLAKLFGISAQAFNKVMSERGMMYRAQKNKKYYPVQKFVDAGMFVAIPDKWGVVYMFTQDGMLSLVQAQDAIFSKCNGFKHVNDLDVLMLQATNEQSYSERKLSEYTE